MPYLTTPEDISNAITYYAQARTLWLDTEVADYQTSKPRLSLIQVLDDSTNMKGDRVMLLDVLDQPDIVNAFIEQIMANPAIEKVIHNASYDCQFLGKRKAQNITCTLKLVQNIPYYLVPLTNYKLKTLAEQLCHFPTIDKIEQGGDWGKRPLTDKQIEYAKMDSVYVAQVHLRLLQLSQLVAPNPITENIEALIRRYREIEHPWKQLDTEIKHLKDRLKQAMEFQAIAERQGFKLAKQKRTTKKVALNDLANIVQNSGIQFDMSLKLSQEWQKQLSEILEQLSLEEEIEETLQLRVREFDQEEV